MSSLCYWYYQWIKVAMETAALAPSCKFLCTSRCGHLLKLAHKFHRHLYFWSLFNAFCIRLIISCVQFVYMYKDCQWFYNILFIDFACERSLSRRESHRAERWAVVLPLPLCSRALATSVLFKKITYSNLLIYLHFGSVRAYIKLFLRGVMPGYWHPSDLICRIRCPFCSSYRWWDCIENENKVAN